ncbi:hypothetical protein [Kribbella sp. NPDC000426]|uniref:hypothetical protein n=1 Tax=Kribbella sp. NPDC000426 TaxID=3154255 RepID=UPI00332524FF
MDINREQVQIAAKSVRGPGESLDPPHVVIQVVASLLGEHKIDHAVSVKVSSRGDERDPFTSWKYAALTGFGLIAVDVTNAIADWELDGSGRREPTPTIDARFIPLGEITHCRVVGIERVSTSFEEWTVSWEIGIRGEQPVRLPEGRYSAERSAASALGRAIADRLCER